MSQETKITYEIYTGDAFPCDQRRGNFGEIDLDAAKTHAENLKDAPRCYQIWRRDVGEDDEPARFEIVYSAEYSAVPGYHQVIPAGDAL